jgi:hypothetical protein
MGKTRGTKAGAYPRMRINGYAHKRGGAEAVRCAEEFLEYVLSHREEFLANVVRGDGALKITTASIEHFVRDRCIPNGWWRKTSFYIHFYKHLIAKLALLGYAVSFEGRGAGRRLMAVPIIERQRALSTS